MNISKTKISHEDMMNASVNNQQTYVGKNLTEADTSRVFFLTGLFLVADVAELKDADGNAIGTLDENGSIHFPLRLDRGFQITSSTNFTLTYFYVPVLKP